MKMYCSRGHNPESNLRISYRGEPECKSCRKISKDKYLSSHPWVISFLSAKGRCQNKKERKYPRYGGRGIKMLMVKEDFKFLWFRDRAFEMKTPSIDRIDNDGNYELSNCRFIEHIVNSGKDIIGENHPNAKLKESQVKRIRFLFKKGFMQTVLAKRFGVSRGAIGSIVRHENWKHC